MELSLWEAARDGDAADVAGWWLQCCCAVFPVCAQFDAISPDEIGTPGYCWLGICCCNNNPTNIYQRVGPRRFGHPEGDLIFSSANCVSDDGLNVDNGCKICGPEIKLFNPGDDCC